MIAGARYGTAALRRQGRCAPPSAGFALTARAIPVFCCQAIKARSPGKPPLAPRMPAAVPWAGEACGDEGSAKILAVALHGDENASVAVFSGVRLLDDNTALAQPGAREFACLNRELGFLRALSLDLGRVDIRDAKGRIKGVAIVVLETIGGTRGRGDRHDTECQGRSIGNGCGPAKVSLMA